MNDRLGHAVERLVLTMADDFEPTGDGPLIGVLDDNKDIAALLRMSLEMEGYRVVVWSSVDHAIADPCWSKANDGEPPVACIVDRMMPGRTGDEFARWARAYRPSLRLLLLSADASGESRELGATDLFDVFLGKEDVLEVGRVLEGWLA